MSMKQYHQWALQSPINVHRTKKPSVAILIALLPRRTWSSTLWAHQRWCHQLPVLSSASHQRQKSSQQHALQENSPNHPISVGTAAPWKCYLIVPSVQRFWLVNFVTCDLSCLFILCEISYVFLCYPGLGLKAWPPNARHGNGRQITTKHPKPLPAQPQATCFCVEVFNSQIKFIHDCTQTCTGDKLIFGAVRTSLSETSQLKEKCSGRRRRRRWRSRIHKKWSL